MIAGEKFSVLANEDQAEFDYLMERYRSVLEPKSHLEQFLIELMVQARWRLARIQRLEAAVHRGAIGGSADDRIAAGLDKLGKGGAFLSRYRKSAEQSYKRAHRELSRMRKAPQPLGPSDLPPVERPAPVKFEFQDLGDFALRS